jgi:hypothetical protein
LYDQQQVVGLLTFRGDTVNGQEVSGFSFVVASNTVMEYVKTAGASNELGVVDKDYRDGLDLYWSAQYKNAIPRFEEVKRLFPQHSEVDRLLQSSQQAIAEGKDKSGFSGVSTGWLIGGVAAVLFVIIALIIIIVVVFLLIRRRGKAKSGATVAAASSKTPSYGAAAAAPIGPANYAPAPPPPTARVATPAPAPWTPPPPAAHAETVDLSRTMAISGPDTSPMYHGLIKFVSGVLTGQSFEVRPEGTCIGRDSGLAQIVIADPRISKRHVWIGVKDGRVAITDQGSRNGTFLNDPKSARVTETILSPGDTVILGESDVARFEYQI